METEKENLENKIPKRTKTLSRNGKWYYKISAERNRAGQVKHYHDNKGLIAPNSILDRLAKSGNVPQLKSFSKYPDIINEAKVLEAYKHFKEHNTEPEKFIETKKRLMAVLKKINDLE